MLFIRKFDFALSTIFKNYILYKYKKKKQWKYNTQINIMEEPILVVDMGSSSIKAGFSGEDTPSYIIPSVLSKNVNKNLEVCPIII